MGESREKKPRSKTKKKSSHGKSSRHHADSSEKYVTDTFKIVRAQVLDFHVKLLNNDEFRSRFLRACLVVLAISFLLVYLTTSRLENQGIRASSIISGSRKTVSAERSVFEIPKLEREKQELNFDVSGNDLLSVKRRFGTRMEYEKAQKLSRAKLSPREEMCYKNMPVQVVRENPSEFSVYKPRKVFDLGVLERVQKKLGYAEESSYKLASLVLKGQPRVVFRQLKEGKQYYDMVASLGRIGSKKKTQLATLRNHVRKFKCSFESLHIQPRSYDMNKPTDCKKFFAHPDKGKMWVLKSCKSGEGSKGAGISVVDDLGPTRQEWGECSENAFNYVAQAYIQRPLLLENRKFDMRAYVFVASTKPYIVFFHPGYIRRSLAEYKPTSTEKNDVLTNYHVQMTRNDFSPGDAMWNFPQFIRYLQDKNLCRACGDIEIKLAQISKLVFDAGRPYYKRFSGSFQLVGLDFMMDEYLNVMFIEGNVSPGIGNHGLKWKRELMDDLVTMMYQQVTMIAERPAEFDLRIGERVYGKYNNYWELIVNEHHEKCNKQVRFDPCKELKPEGIDVDPEDLRAADEGSESSSSGGDDDSDD